MPNTKRRATITLLGAPVVAVTILAGVWVAGGVITSDFRTSIALTTAWFAVSAAVCLLIARRWRPLRIPVIAAYLVTVGATAAYLAATTLRDDVVHEHVIMAVAPPASTIGGAARSGPVELAQGPFRSHEHATKGTARVIRATDGRRFLTLTEFATSPGPDLRVRLVPAGLFDGGADGAVDLGGLKGNRGDQQYAIPSGTNATGRTVVIWCRAFSAPFGSAALRPMA